MLAVSALPIQNAANDDSAMTLRSVVQHRRELRLFATGRGAAGPTLRCGLCALRIDVRALVGLDGIGRIKHFPHGLLQGGFPEHEIAGKVVAMAQQGGQHMIGTPKIELVGRFEFAGMRMHEVSPQEALRAHVLEEPGQVREQSC